MPDVKFTDEQRQLLIVFVTEHWVRLHALNPGFEQEADECVDLLRLLQGTDTVLISRRM